MMVHDHGTVTFTTTTDRDGVARQRTLPLGPIQNTIVQMILMGCVIQTHKTHHRIGRKAVSIGPYKRATDEKTQRWAVFIGNECNAYLSPVDAARHFIEYCNRTIAREAVKAYARNNRY